jgi:ribonuclease P protein component
MTRDVPAAPLEAAKAPERLRRRREFVRASKFGARLNGPAFALQMVARGEEPGGAARFGVTVTKKVAGAVGRNRIRRRLKEALRVSGAPGARPGCDYVLVARPPALNAPFTQLLSQLAEGLAHLERRAPKPDRRKP